MLKMVTAMTVMDRCSIGGGAARKFTKVSDSVRERYLIIRCYIGSVYGF